MRFAHRAARPLAGARRLVAVAALAVSAGLPAAPAAAQGGAIHFGESAGEDQLIGGGFQADAPQGAAGYAGGTFHREPAARAAYRHSSPSVVFYPRPVGSTYDRGTGIFANARGGGGGWVLGGGGSVQSLPSRSGRARGETGAKIIDVAVARLDRQPAGRSGVSIQYVGSAKIIRILPGGAARRTERDHRVERPEKDMAALPAPAGPSPYTPPAPTPASAPGPTEERAAAEPDAPSGAARTVLEPWTDEWLRDCLARHPDFDASLGTYTGADGLRRFCTGEAG